MGCLLPIVSLIAPRGAIILMALFTNCFSQAFSSPLLWPLLGFLFLPYTLLTYTLWVVFFGSFGLFGLLAVIIALCADLGGQGTSVSKS